MRLETPSRVYVRVLVTNASPAATDSILSWLNFPLTRMHVRDA